jgi:hypothetical protein
MNKIQILKNTLFWGFILWLIGWALGVVLFMTPLKSVIGWVITPIGVIITLWVLIKKIEREEFMCFFGVGLIWTIMAVVLDYIFNVKLFNISNYYKFDIYLYYLLTFLLPICVGWYKIKLKTKK